MHLLLLPFHLVISAVHLVLRVIVAALRIIGKALLTILGLYDDIPIFIAGIFSQLFHRRRTQP